VSQTDSDDDAGPNGPGDEPDGPVIVVANEFADVRVRRVRTRNGVRLEIFSPRRGTRVHLDAVELDLLSFQEPEVFSEMLERTPRPGG
jgi:hypothetical protein